MNFLGKLFRRKKPAAKHASVIYRDFVITPAPQPRSGGFSTEARISKEIDGETLSHHFIRADTSPDMESAVALTLNKCKICIDQRGDALFAPRE